MNIIKKLSLCVLVAGYLAGGINHFINPAIYISIIPPYLLFPNLINVMAGLFELVFAFMLISSRTRNIAAYGIAFMLILFLPVHIQMIINAPFKLGRWVITPLIAWIRLLLQPVLIAWVLWHKRK